MIYTELTMKAMKLAYDAHHGQTDKAGMPYIFHPMHLAEQMDDEVSTCVALLHDVVEDTSVTLAQLEKLFPAEVVQAVALMTHADDVDYFDYVRNTRGNEAARKVKLADLAHNSDATRLPASAAGSERARARLEKYRIARSILLEGEKI